MRGWGRSGYDSGVLCRDAPQVVGGELKEASTDFKKIVSDVRIIEYRETRDS